ncbi:MAG TPA: Ig-like domain-containing protein [Thermoanaerobaculia bacterium]|nr:Ig-like domain-containing protein [Thermoanaerobaculia bacterium]
MQRIVFILVLLLAAAAEARVTFVAPLDGSQAFGPQTLEITTDAAAVDRVDFAVDGVLAGVARKAPYRVPYDFGTSLAARKVTATVWTNGFKGSESATVTTAAMTANDTLDVDLVEVPLRVRAARTVRPSDLRVRENGVEQTVRDVRQERPPAHFAFVVDRSLSMGGGKLEAALRAIRAELRQLRPGDTSSVVLFNHQVAKPVAVPAATATPSGGTSLRDALASVSAKQRTYAIVISDGGDRTSVLSDEEALRKISGTKTIVHALVLGDSHARFLDRAAENTGGRVVRASTSSVGTELRRVLEDINSRYLVVYQSQGTKRGWRTIEVRSSRVDVVNARKGYFAE